MRISGDNLLPSFLAAPFDEPKIFGDDVFDIEQGIAVLKSTCEFRVRVDAAVQVEPFVSNVIPSKTSDDAKKLYGIMRLQRSQVPYRLMAK